MEIVKRLGEHCCRTYIEGCAVNHVRDMACIFLSTQSFTRGYDKPTQALVKKRSAPSRDEVPTSLETMFREGASA